MNDSTDRNPADSEPAAGESAETFERERDKDCLVTDEDCLGEQV